jgi:NAD(P)-dependent dehydrogenase (short-subunit alcohol dehydrogenase family)
MHARTALVTGASGDIGRTIAAALAREGATVVLTGRNLERGQEIADRIREQGGEAHFTAAELSTGQPAIRRLMDDIAHRTGRSIDILIINAAHTPPSQPLGEVSDEQIDQTYAMTSAAHSAGRPNTATYQPVSSASACCWPLLPAAPP